MDSSSQWLTADCYFQFVRFRIGRHFQLPDQPLHRCRRHYFFPLPVLLQQLRRRYFHIHNSYCRPICCKKTDQLLPHLPGDIGSVPHKGSFFPEIYPGLFLRGLDHCAIAAFISRTYFHGLPDIIQGDDRQLLVMPPDISILPGARQSTHQDHRCLRCFKKASGNLPSSRFVVIQASTTPVALQARNLESRRS